MKIRIRDLLLVVLTPWMANRPGMTVLFRLLWAVVSPLDWLLEIAYEGLQAAWPGVGTPTALPYVGRSRGIIRGQTESDSAYAARLRNWLTYWARAGSSDQIATAVHDYLTGNPRVDVITRNGAQTRCDTDGTITRTTIGWDWDSISNPERSGNWAEFFIVVYTSNYSGAGNWGSDGQLWGDPIGLGDTNTATEFDALVALIGQWKSAHSVCRCLIVNKNNTQPVPNGRWGQWDNRAGAYGSRDTTNNYFWEF